MDAPSRKILLDIRKSVFIDHRPLNIQPPRPMVVWLNRHEPHELESPMRYLLHAEFWRRYERWPLCL